MISRGVDIFECRICQPRDILWMWIYYRSWGVDIFECGQHFSSLVMKITSLTFNVTCLATSIAPRDHCKGYNNGTSPSSAKHVFSGIRLFQRTRNDCQGARVTSLGIADSSAGFRWPWGKQRKMMWQNHGYLQTYMWKTAILFRSHHGFSTSFPTLSPLKYHKDILLVIYPTISPLCIICRSLS